ncbi:MAG: spore coat associated protein CotJA [Clostridia bacterium]|nr:spore coat associated protein CotJA [Clostridia bacterium]
MNTVHDPSMIAMVFSPKQSFHKLYEPEKALCRGTLFEELDKPFHPHCSR